MNGKSMGSTSYQRSLGFDSSLIKADYSGFGTFRRSVFEPRRQHDGQVPNVRIRSAGPGPNVQSPHPHAQQRTRYLTANQLISFIDL